MEWEGTHQTLHQRPSGCDRDRRSSLPGCVLTNVSMTHSVF